MILKLKIILVFNHKLAPKNMKNTIDFKNKRYLDIFLY